MKKFMLIFTILTLIVLVVGMVSYSINDSKEILDAWNSQYENPKETVWKYPIYDYTYRGVKLIDDCIERLTKTSNALDK